MATPSMMAWPWLVEPERAEPCILLVMYEPVRVRARVLRPLLCALCPHAPAGTRRPHGRAVRLWLVLC